MDNSMILSRCYYKSSRNVHFRKYRKKCRVQTTINSITIKLILGMEWVYAWRAWTQMGFAEPRLARVCKTRLKFPEPKNLGEIESRNGTPSCKAPRQPTIFVTRNNGEWKLGTLVVLFIQLIHPMVNIYKFIFSFFGLFNFFPKMQ